MRETYLPAQKVWGGGREWGGVAPPLFLGLLQDPCPLWERVQAAHLPPRTPVLEGWLPGISSDPLRPPQVGRAVLHPTPHVRCRGRQRFH